MASIILSFVGKQDPFSDVNYTEGSIVSLVKHLLQQQQPIKRIILLHTAETASGAADTQTWLVTDLQLPSDRIQLIPVEAELSQDPVNLLLAAQAARSGIDQALPYLDPSSDTLELNASSGTPVMKSAWSILQAAGYAPRSHVWQVRNPDKMRSGQARVFQTDVTTLKDEFDLKVIQQQIQDYNYSGALITLRQSNLQSPAIAALLDYGYHRLAMDFDRAFAALNGLSEIDPIWIQEISPLRQRDSRSLLQESYFNGLVRLHNRQYADFLVVLFKLQEQLLYYLVKDRIGLAISGKPADQEQSWEVIRGVDQGRLYDFLRQYKLPKGGFIYLDRSISRYVLQAIVEYYPQFRTVLPRIQDLNVYCNLRNESVHGFVGVSEIENEAYLLTTLRKLMQQTCGLPSVCPFDRLNQTLRDRLFAG